MTVRFGRGPVGAFESSWSGAPGTVPWTRTLGPLAAAYAAAAARARRRAARSRRRVPDLRVVAVGNLTVGGTGKSSLARWLAGRAVELSRGRSAVLLRGHGGSRAGPASEPQVVPDFPGYPLRRSAERFGDEAAAHRAGLPREVAVIAGRDRRRSALIARDGYGAKTVVLDDGWEQDTLAWDALWVALDPERPFGNGRGLPAGPLRRPAPTIAEAAVIALVLDDAGSEGGAGLDAARRFAPGAPVVRFRRVLREPLAARGPAALLTAVGSPGRVERFARGVGVDLAAHVAFPDHARVDPERLREALRWAARQNVTVALVTEKDEHRWTFPADAPLPVLVLRTDLAPLDPVDHLPGLGSL